MKKRLTCICISVIVDFDGVAKVAHINCKCPNN